MQSLKKASLLVGMFFAGIIAFVALLAGMGTGPRVEDSIITQALWALAILFVAGLWFTAIERVLRKMR